MITICTGKILRNGICDTCYHLSQSSSGDCGRMIEVGESEEKEEPKEEIDPLGGMQPTQLKDLFTRSQVREEIRKAMIMANRLLDNYSYTDTDGMTKEIDQYLKENGF